MLKELHFTFLKQEYLHKSNKTKNVISYSSLARTSMLTQDIDFEALQHASTELCIELMDEAQCQAFLTKVTMLYLPSPHRHLHHAHIHEHTHARITLYAIRTSSGPRFVSRPEAFVPFSPVCCSFIHTASPHPTMQRNCMNCVH